MPALGSGGTGIGPPPSLATLRSMRDAARSGTPPRGTRAGSSSAPVELKGKAQFQQADGDGDGKLDQAEVMAFIKDLGYTNVSADYIDGVWDAFDQVNPLHPRPAAVPGCAAHVCCLVRAPPQSRRRRAQKARL